MKYFNSKRLKIAVAAALCAGIVGCSSDDDATADDGSTGDDQLATLSLAFAGLDDLGDDYVYEGWLLVNGAPVSTGRFTSNSSDEQTATVEDAEAATKYILTIEPAEGDVPAAADTHVLAGDIIDSGATLTIGDGAALGDSFANSTGSFIIATPTDADASYAQGIWWLAPTDAGNIAGLNLPTLPAGWAYEGWIVDGGVPISTGTFTDVAAADSDAGGETAGTADAPPFPGQDFVTPALDIIGLTAVISVEPSPDNSPEPFGIKPLIDATIEDVGAAGSQDMENAIAGNQPTGTLSIVMP